MSTAGARGVTGGTPAAFLDASSTAPPGAEPARNARRPRRVPRRTPARPQPSVGPPSPALLRLRELYAWVREIDPEGYPPEERRSVARTLEGIQSLSKWYAKRVRARLDLDASRP